MVARDQGVGRSKNPFDSDEHMDLVYAAEMDIFELYHIPTDVGQTNELSSQEPAIAAAMRAKLENIAAEAFAEGPDWRDQTRIYNDWAAANITDPGQRGPSDNPDGDSADNLHEFVAQTHPEVADGGGVAMRIVAAKPGRVQVPISFNPHAYGLSVTLFAADNPTGPWTPVASKQAGHFPGFEALDSGFTIAGETSNTVTPEDSSVGTHPKRFYKTVFTLP
ncbi:MAG: hypothetical protein HC901_02025 [Bdellovibrionaceae bacterium]|nr:hypothetical protein [Pseudobdellovibrionaceae bacterium]